MKKTNEQIAIEVSRNTIIGNAVLSAFKLFAGFYANSGAMISDAVHSLSDLFTTFIVIIGVKWSNRKSDKDHPYGHERMECVAALILSVILFAVGIIIGWGGIEKIINGNYEEIAIPGVLALIAAIVSIVIKEVMYWYTRIAAKAINSSALFADAWHHRSDAFSSIGSFAGILGARLGFPILDPVACVVICIFILKVAFDIFLDSIGKMTDKACDDAVVDEIRAVVLAQESVGGIDQIKTRLFGDRIYVDIEIRVNGNFTLYEAHEIAQHVHDAIERQFPKVKHCMVHVNPDNVNREQISETQNI
jgi:cation diffusion facilitator family transporter